MYESDIIFVREVIYINSETILYIVGVFPIFEDGYDVVGGGGIFEKFGGL